MRQSTFFIFICCAVTSQQVAAANTLGAYHARVRKVVTEGSQVSLQCRLPLKVQVARMVDRTSDSSPSPPVIWLRFDGQEEEVISHGDQLLMEGFNPRMRLSFDEETATSVLIIDGAQSYDSGVFQCQVVVGDEVMPSAPIEVVVIDGRSSSTSNIVAHSVLLLLSLQTMFYLLC